MIAAAVVIIIIDVIAVVCMPSSTDTDAQRFEIQIVVFFYSSYFIFHPS